MRIAIFTNNYLPNPYGVSTSIESFRKELEKMGHSVYIFAPHFKDFTDENPNIYRYPSLDFTFRGVNYPIAIPFSYSISRILKGLEIDVIHAQHPNLLGWVAKRWAKKKNVPLIFTWHTLYDQYAHFAPLIPKQVAAWWSIGNARRFANFADQIIVPTPTVKTIITKWGVKNPKITAIASGIEEEKFANANGEIIRKKYNILEDEVLILLVSRLTAEKNVEFIFKSLLPLLLTEKKVKFLIAGGGNEKEQLERMVNKNGLENQITFAGIIKQGDIKNYYSAADIFVYASKSETQGMILTEAMYMGVPIVAVKAPGAQDLVGNFVTGILTKEDESEFALAISKLVKDKELRTQYGENAKRVAQENYTAKNCTNKLLDIYQKALANKIKQIGRNSK